MFPRSVNNSHPPFSLHAMPRAARFGLRSAPADELRSRESRLSEPTCWVVLIIQFTSNDAFIRASPSSPSPLRYSLTHYPNNVRLRLPLLATNSKHMFFVLSRSVFFCESELHIGILQCECRAQLQLKAYRRL